MFLVVKPLPFAMLLAADVALVVAALTLLAYRRRSSSFFRLHYLITLFQWQLHSQLPWFQHVPSMTRNPPPLQTVEVGRLRANQRGKLLESKLWN